MSVDGLLARDNPDIQFVSFRSFVHPSFWFKLSELKLEVDKLDESEKQIYGRYTYRNDIDTVFEVDGTSFNKYPESDLHYITVKGTLINKNTLEDLHSLETQQLMNDVGLKIWERLTTHEWIAHPDTLNEFYLVTHANLKKFHYHYWFGFPAPVEPSYHMRESGHLGQYFNEAEIEDIAKGYKALDKNQKSFFVILRNDGKTIVSTLKDYFDAHDGDLDFNDVHFSFSDPAQFLVPGWPLRVFLAALGDYLGLGNLYGKTLKIIGIKCKPNYRDFQHSSLYNVKIVEDTAPTEPGSWAGWERNENKKYSPRFADMSLSMDPKHLADEGADLNIKLMKWRLAPELDLDSIKFTKCLLLGAGTLGCHVARGLLAWGFRNITFVDNGKVSYSNPTRQVLFNHADCLGGGQQKAAAAAESLKHILPSVNSAGVSLHIPMPGHPVGASLRAETATNVATLQRLVADHDVVFLLLDTREARWLPTLLAAAGRKLAITAALGFDSYLVMRHGQGPGEGWAVEGAPAAPAGTLSGRSLGCYFCNDVTAPGNSMKDRTLDQQCTVTRPGVAAVAGALAAEMLAGILQHPLRGEAPALISEVPDSEGVSGVLGPVPHSIRGFLHNYQQVQPTCQKFPQCVGCSETVIKKYKEEGDEFIFNVLNSGTYLEEVTGLKALHLAAEMSDVLTLDDDDDETA